jgi:hypothetical protein
MEKIVILKEEYVIIQSKLIEDDFLVVHDCMKNEKNYQVLGIHGFDSERHKKRLFKNLLSLMVYVNKSALATPRIVKIDKKQMFIVREVLAGDRIFDLLAKQDLGEDVLSKLFFSFKCAKSMGLNLDYNPASFVWLNGKLYYNALVFVDYVQDKDLINNGLMLWFYTPEAVVQLTKLGYKKDSSRLKPRGEQNKEIVLSVYKHYNF